MKILKKEPPFIKFLAFALLAIALNVSTSYLAGFANTLTTVTYSSGVVLLVCFIVMYKMGYEFAAKLSSTIFFNVFFFTFTLIYGLRSLAFIYYFPFLISHLFMYKDSATKKEAKIFTFSCIGCLIITFLVCSMNGRNMLTKQQEMIMFKRNFIVAFALSAYYFNAIFNYLMVQMKLAQEASASKARFLSIMSHELRTPLNGIISAINLISTTTNEHDKQKFSVVLKSSSEHLLHLVNNVLDYSKATSGKMELNLVSCSIESLLLNLKEVFQSRFNESGIALIILIDEEIKQPVLIDDIRFIQVLTNLLSNALKFTEKGQVLVAVRCVGIDTSTIDVEVSVTDTGKGLTPEQEKKIFETFNTVHNKSGKVESSGLGLSICNMILEMMGSTLLVESIVDRGSKFYFKISLPFADKEEIKPAAIKVATNSIDGMSILVAEDNLINMLVTKEFLKRWNVNIFEAANGLIAQEILIKNPDIDLLLLDLQMPEMDGYELMNWIRESGLDLPVVAFTAEIMETQERLDLFAQGFTDIISKPFAPEELQQKLQAALLIKND